MNIRKFFQSAWFKRLLQALFVLGSFYFLGASFFENRVAIVALFRSLDWGIFSAALVLLFLSFLPRPAALYYFLRGSAEQIRFVDSSRAYFLSQLAKYLPGGVWVFPSRVILLRDSGVSASSASLGLMYESIAMVISSALVAFPALAVVPAAQLIHPGWVWGVGLGSVLGILAVLFSPEWLQKITPTLFRRLNFLESMAKIPKRLRVVNISLSTGIYTLMWISTGISFYMLILALGGDTDLDFYIPVGIFALAWLVGFLSVFNPGGIGLREAAILLFLGNWLPESQLVLLALLSRVAWSLVEVLYFGWFSLFKPVPPSPDLQSS